MCRFFILLRNKSYYFKPCRSKDTFDGSLPGFVFFDHGLRVGDVSWHFAFPVQVRQCGHLPHQIHTTLEEGGEKFVLDLKSTDRIQVWQLTCIFCLLVLKIK